MTQNFEAAAIKDPGPNLQEMLNLLNATDKRVLVEMLGLLICLNIHPSMGALLGLIHRTVETEYLAKGIPIQNERPSIPNP